ncbi:MAG: sugar phosphate isomerase/epimerase [Verrucomicrobiae bacterium]|nr:sugar phosphate isomerase/epimerase [Verrucomicrobiae bacterium]
MKYSMFSLSLPQCTPAEAAALVKEAGYDGMEWRCFARPDPMPPIPNCWQSNRTTLDWKNWKKAVPEYKRLMAEHGLEFSNLGCYCRADQVEEVKTGIAIAKELGSPRLRVCAPPYDGKENYRSVLARARDQYANAAELCKAAGVQGLLELHMGNIAPSASMGFRLLDGCDPSAMGVMLDPGNMAFEGYENWKMGCELLGPYLAFVHAKNSRRRACGVVAPGSISYEYEACEMHTGFVDWVAVFKALKAVGYDGWISNEDYHLATGCGFERIRDGLAFLKKCEQAAKEAAP